MTGAIEHVLSPVGLPAFFDDYWESSPLHVARREANRFASLLSLGAIEHVLSSRALTFPNVQLTESGTAVPPERYTDASNRIVPRRLLERHHAGATLVLSRAHDLFPPLAALVRELELAFGWRCQMNVYLSPAGHRGFGSHYDTHDVFILQVAGRKAFRFYAGGVELPFPDERYDAGATGERIPGETIAVAAGDTLYVPRGVIHDALAEDEAPSLHITLGVFPIVLRDVLREAVQVAAERDLALRRSDRGDDSDGQAAALMALLGTDVIAEARSRLRDEVALDGLPDCTGRLHPATDDTPAAPVGPEMTLSVHAGIHAGLERSGEVVIIRRPGDVLEFAEPMATAVERLVSAGKARVDDLVGLDAGRRVALARQLLAQHVCRVADDTP